MPYPLVLALFAAIAEWVPIIGPIVAAIPAIILASLVGPALVVKIIITYAIIQLIDGQIVMPKILGHVIKLHPLVILTVNFCRRLFLWHHRYDDGSADHSDVTNRAYKTLVF